MGAEVLGGRLLGEVEGGELGELLSSLRDLQNPGPRNHFGIPALDTLFNHAAPPHGNPTVNAEQPQIGNYDTQFHTHSTVTRPKQTQNIPSKSKPPIIELVSTTPGAGKTHLLYLIMCIAVLPPTFHGISLSGKTSAIVVIDSESSFNIPRLAEVMLEYVLGKLHSTSTINPATLNHPKTTYSATPKSPRTIDPVLRAELTALIKSSLHHIHIFHPQTISSLLSILKSLPTYLFNPTSHPSTHRPIHTIIIPSIDAFAWEIRSQSSTAAAKSITSPYTLLTSQLNKLSTTFQAPVITTALALSLHPFRSSLPPTWTRGVDVRIGVSRVEGKKFREGVAWEDVVGLKEKGGEVGKRAEFEMGVLGGRGAGERRRFKIGRGVWFGDEEGRLGEGGRE